MQNRELANLREVEDDLEDERYGEDMMNDLHSQQIDVKNFELKPQLQTSKTMMVQKRPSAIGSGIGGGLKRPTLMKPPSTNNGSHGITGSKNMQ